METARDTQFDQFLAGAQTAFDESEPLGLNSGVEQARQLQRQLRPHLPGSGIGLPVERAAEQQVLDATAVAAGETNPVVIEAECAAETQARTDLHVLQPGLEHRAVDRGQPVESRGERRTRIGQPQTVIEREQYRSDGVTPGGPEPQTVLLTLSTVERQLEVSAQAELSGGLPRQPPVCEHGWAQRRRYDAGA